MIHLKPRLRVQKESEEKVFHSGLGGTFKSIPVVKSATRESPLSPVEDEKQRMKALSSNSAYTVRMSTFKRVR
jgi:hypothetical protein